MDVIAELKRLQCDPGPTHSPNECPCDMPQPCSCMVGAAAIDEIEKLRSALAAIRAASPPDTAYSWGTIKLSECHRIAVSAVGEAATADQP
jgi:hypothetical protein